MLALTDYWREINPDSRRYTFHRKSQGSRLDYWFISNFYKNKVQKCTIDIGTHSDHSPLTLNILTEKPKRGPGMWKINNILLKDQEYVQRIKDLFKGVENENLELHPSAHWDYLKYKIKMSSIKFSRVKSSK